MRKVLSSRGEERVSQASALGYADPGLENDSPHRDHSKRFSVRGSVKYDSAVCIIHCWHDTAIPAAAYVCFHNINFPASLSFELLKKAGSVLGTDPALDLVVERRMLHRLLDIMDKCTQPTQVTGQTTEYL